MVLKGIADIDWVLKGIADIYCVADFYCGAGWDSRCIVLKGTVFIYSGGTEDGRYHCWAEGDCRYLLCGSKGLHISIVGLEGTADIYCGVKGLYCGVQ